MLDSRRSIHLKVDRARDESVIRKTDTYTAMSRIRITSAVMTQVQQVAGVMRWLINILLQIVLFKYILHQIIDAIFLNTWTDV